MNKQNITHFKIGEIAIINCPDSIDHNHEVEITSILMPAKTICNKCLTKANSIPAYTVRNSNGVNGWAAPKHLRKKRPPEKLSTWEEVQKDTNWNPAKQEQIT